VFNILPTVRLMTPTADAAGATTNGRNETILDEVPGSGFYDVVGNESCGSGKSGLLGAGALSPFALFLLLLPAVLRRRKVTAPDRTGRQNREVL
jgi:hypothetical protein